MKTKAKEFFQTFKPFLGKKWRDETNVNIINDKVEKDQSIVAEELATYFPTMAETDLGKDLGEQDFKQHSSIKAIREANKVTCFEFRRIIPEEVERES